jgi:hypothetical protein
MMLRSKEKKHTTSLDVSKVRLGSEDIKEKDD